eukprot:gnl/TRDRNA2_/TRDRNA2_176749_c0_seq4.p1 gnl/TRDRNA2_/TRDRNA2_176749_c0~~gnl/TRDRNA2_/TRDRNA2_176749_c0_seq4.p1  ORF type:complete len:512 (-),score=43.93 gnl/TRDRNA2_/TRDRNA2_176749_c0_seq4:104-1510(-)
MSLARRVCEHDESLGTSTFQMEALKDMVHFALGSAGPFLMVVCLIVWFLAICKEMNSIVDYVLAFCTVPRDTRTTWKVSESAGLRLQTLSRARFALMMFVGAARLAVAIGLLVAGGIWLTSTYALRDLILDAVALAFIMELDEMIYGVMVPRRTRVLLENVEPLPDPKRSSYKGLGFRSVCGVFALVVYIWLFIEACVQPNADTYLAIVQELCGGDLDFVYKVHPATGLVVSAPSGGQPGINHNSYQAKAVRELIWNSSQYPPKMSRREVSIKALHEFVSLSMDDLASRYTCDNWLLDSEDTSNYWKELLHARTGEAYSSCADLSIHCNDRYFPLVRMICPKTCQCDQALGSLVYQTGCPVRNCYVGDGGVGNWSLFSECEDMSYSEVSANPNWISHWQRLLDDDEVAKEDFDIAMTEGCDMFDRVKYRFHCREESHLTSLAAFCPLSCACKGYNKFVCPSACFAEAV